MENVKIIVCTTAEIISISIFATTSAWQRGGKDLISSDIIQVRWASSQLSDLKFPQDSIRRKLLKLVHSKSLFKIWGIFLRHSVDAFVFETVFKWDKILYFTYLL